MIRKYTAKFKLVDVQSQRVIVYHYYQVLHRWAKTTEAVRRAIQNSRLL